MDLNEALAALRVAFPRVGWVLDDEFGYIFAAGFHNATIVAVLPPAEDGLWDAGVGSGLHLKSPDPVSAVRAWLAAQPTAVFYPAPPSGETVEVRGCTAVDKDGAYAVYGSSLAGDNVRGITLFHLSKVSLAAAGDVTVRAFTLRVPVPVEPPVLMGEVTDV